MEANIVGVGMLRSWTEKKFGTILVGKHEGKREL